MKAVTSLPRKAGPLPQSVITAILEEPYLDAVLKESMRAHVAISVALPRVVPAGIELDLDGYRVPEGTVVSTFTYAIHRDEEVFGGEKPELDVENFFPERWLSSEHSSGSAPEKQGAGRTQEMNRRLWAFGSGSRSCVGRQFVPLSLPIDYHGCTQIHAESLVIIGVMFGDCSAKIPCKTRNQ